MKRYSVLVLILALTVLMFSYCKTSKKAQAAEPPKVAYKDGLHTVIMANCSPCHIPEKGGNKKAYDNYTNTKADIDEILRRIQLNPGEKGFMPFRKDKLNDSTIAVFKQWKDQGMLE